MSTETTTETAAATPIVTTTVDLVIRLQVAGSPAEVARYRAALECLAEVMVVQAEDGLWTLGCADGEGDDGPSEHVADIESARVHAVLIGEATHDALQARCERLEAIADELAIIASHAVHIPGKTTAMDERIAALVRELDTSS